MQFVFGTNEKFDLLGIQADRIKQENNSEYNDSDSNDDEEYIDNCRQCVAP